MRYARLILSCLALSAALFLPRGSGAATALTIDIFGPGQNVATMALADPEGPGGAPAPAEAATLRDLLAQNFGILPFLRLVRPGEVLGGVDLAGVTRDAIDFHRFQISKVDLVTTFGWTPGAKGARVECRVYEAFSGNLVAGKAYSNVRPESLPLVADLFAATFMEAVAGDGSIFRSTLAVTKGGKGKDREIWTVTPQGRDTARVTLFGGSSVSTSWSRDGRYLAFAHHGPAAHTLGIWDKEHNQLSRYRLPGETIGGLDFLPGNRLVVALSRGNMDIHLLTPDMLKVEKTLVSHWGIDVSPSFDREGKKMAFVSDRQGTPQVYVQDMGGEPRRVTHEGTYNTSPSLSPDGRYVAYSRRTPSGHRIALLDLQTGSDRLISDGPGNDEEPAFAPDGYFIAFAGSRSGAYKIYLTTRHGAPAKLVPTGEEPATHPSFGLTAKP
jgi:TolB protein